jgi:hypothetical protein
VGQNTEKGMKSIHEGRTGEEHGKQCDGQESKREENEQK